MGQPREDNGQWAKQAEAVSPAKLAFTASVESQYADAVRHLEVTREWAYPGVGDLEAERELDAAYRAVKEFQARRDDQRAAS